MALNRYKFDKNDMRCKSRWGLGVSWRVLSLSFMMGAGIMGAGIVFAVPMSYAQERVQDDVNIQEAELLTLEKAVDAGLKTNPNYQSVLNNKLATDQGLPQARAAYLPSIDVNADIGREITDNTTTRANNNGGSESLTRRRVSVTISQLVFDGFQTKYAVERQKNAIESASYDVLDTAHQTALNIVSLYLDVMLQGELLDIAKENVATHERILIDVRASTQAGRTSQVDVSQVESRLASARSQMTSVQEALQVSKSQFYREAGIEAENLAPVHDYLQAIHPSLDEQLRAVLVTNNAVLRAKEDVDVAKAEYDQSIAPYYPNVSLRASAQAGEDLGGIDATDNDASLVGAVDWNLYNGGADKARRKELEYRLLQSQEVAREAANQIEETTRITWAQMIAARERQISFQLQATANKDLVDAYLQQFNLGRRTLLDVLDVQSESFSSQSSLLSERVDEQSAAFSLLALESRLLDVLGVDVVVPGE